MPLLTLQGPQQTLVGPERHWPPHLRSERVAFAPLHGAYVVCVHLVGINRSETFEARRCRGSALLSLKAPVEGLETSSTFVRGKLHLRQINQRRI